MNTVKIKSSRRTARDRYHHGDLKRELLRAAEQVILERGVHGFTLREAARRAGVSPAAPAHHFKDARGLLTELAAQGFREFADALQAADAAAGPDPSQRLANQATAYVTYALNHPARFQLMFSHDLHDPSDTALQVEGARAYGILTAAVRAATVAGAGTIGATRDTRDIGVADAPLSASTHASESGLSATTAGMADKAALSPAAHGFLLATWSLVHGFAHLALGGELRDAAGRVPDRETILTTLLPAVVSQMLERRS